MEKSKQVILSDLKTSFEVLYKTANLVSDDLFNTSKENKWTPAENIQHLITAAKMTSLPFTLPKFVPSLLYGKATGKSKTYDEVVAAYKRELAGGAKASGVYIPKKTNYDREKLGQQILKEAEKLAQAIDVKWTEEDLDRYRIAHPILGKLTMRELAYFTIYHNIHHMEIIRKYYL